ncbi:hypothetical protein FRC19_004872 [Serendipita sp. 401]|nr:hypothetical protein FRC19_004872 [Serendipita sp. 401]
MREPTTSSIDDEIVNSRAYQRAAVPSQFLIPIPSPFTPPPIIGTQEVPSRNNRHDFFARNQSTLNWNRVVTDDIHYPTSSPHQQSHGSFRPIYETENFYTESIFGVEEPTEETIDKPNRISSEDGI